MKKSKRETVTKQVTVFGWIKLEEKSNSSPPWKKVTDKKGSFIWGKRQRIKSY